MAHYLMSKATTEAYIAVFLHFLQILKQSNKNFRVVRMMADFGAATRAAAREVFNFDDDDELLACFFHYKQLLLRRAIRHRITKPEELSNNIFY